MEHPYYSVVVTNLSRGWTYSAVEGQEWDPADDVVLVAPFSYGWAFANDLMPAQLDAFAATVNLVARTGSVVPETQVGDLVSFTVRVGTDGPYIAAPPPMRVTEQTVELTPRRKYTAFVTLQLTDLSVDWRAAALGAVYNGGQAKDAWRERLAEVSAIIGVSIGCPTWWDDDEGPAGSFGLHPVYSRRDASGFNDNALSVLTKLANSHQPDGRTHSWTTVYGPHPAGYRRVGPDTWVNDDPIPEPNTSIRIEAVPASRRASGAAGLPLQLEVIDGVLTLTARPPATEDAMTILALDADWCIVPARARRARESVINTVVVTGQGVTREVKDGMDGSDGSEFNYDFINDQRTASVAGNLGAVTREVPTQLYTGAIGYSDVIYGPPAPEVSLVADAFLSDGTALGTMWAYDQFLVRPSAMPQDVAESILPVLAPRVPGEVDGDDHLVRQVTIFRLLQDVRLGAQAPSGFVTSGTMQITGGEVEVYLTMTPGRPVWTDFAPSPITVGEFEDAFGALTFADLDPSSIALGELDLVEAP